MPSQSPHPTLGTPRLGRIPAVLVVLMCLAGCSDVSRPTTAPGASVVPPSAKDDTTRPAGTSDGSPFGLEAGLGRMPLTPGRWSRAEAGLQFGDAASEPRLALVCDRRTGDVGLRRAGALGLSERLRLSLVTETGSASGFWRASGDALPELVGRVSASDAVWATVADRFGVGVEGRPPLVLPVTDLVRTFLDGCDGNRTVAPDAARDAAETLAVALDGEGLRFVTRPTGSTRLLAFGTPLAGVVSAVTRSRGAPADTGTNTECGAGPLAVVTWPDGLTVYGSGEAFVGWAVNRRRGADTSANATMAGTRLGSTRADLDGVYTADVQQTTLGTEFSAGGFWGILSGTGPGATIDALWAGTSCNFR